MKAGDYATKPAARPLELLMQDSTKMAPLYVTDIYKGAMQKLGASFPGDQKPALRTSRGIYQIPKEREKQI
jgi:hypothetical protein